MSAEWGQAIIFFLTPLFFMLLLIETDEDDDGPPDGGMLTPVYAPCLLYTSPSPRDRTRSRMPSSA